MRLEDEYFLWLYSQFGAIQTRSRARKFTKLARVLHSIEFVWFIPNDDNRVEDGRALRDLFLDEADVDADEEWCSMGCSFLEMLVALAKRCAFETDGSSRDWFWHLADNIGIGKFSDAEDFSEDTIRDIVDCVVWRTYNPDGDGGLFPLADPKEDQRTVELWYQMSAYLLELG